MTPEAADYLARKGMPFRDAHRVVGQIVARAIAEHRGIENLSLVEKHGDEVCVRAETLVGYIAQIEASFAGVLESYDYCPFDVGRRHARNGRYPCRGRNAYPVRELLRAPIAASENVCPPGRDCGSRP